MDKSKTPRAQAACIVPEAQMRLEETRKAFDGMARDLDSPLDSNILIRSMRIRMWRMIEQSVPAGGRLLDVGCGTGIDAEHLARSGYQVVASDLSSEMVKRASARVAGAGLSSRVRAVQIGVHELHQLAGERFEAIYSNLGPMNCAPDLLSAANSCFTLLNPGGKLFVSVMGRICPWEVLFYGVHGEWRRALVRTSKGSVPVSLSGNTAWTRYFTPREFYRHFSEGFDLSHYSALLLFLPPPYLDGFCQRWPKISTALGWLDERLGDFPLMRNAGDHFLMVLTRHG